MKQFVTIVTVLGLALILSCARQPERKTELETRPAEKLDYDINVEFISKKVSGEGSWFQPRPAAIPNTGSNGKPDVIMTIQKALPVKYSDYFSGLYVMRSNDFGITWTDPKEEPALAWNITEEEIIECMADFTLGWHQPTGKILGIGVLTLYKGEGPAFFTHGRYIGYASYDPKTNRWAPFAKLEMPNREKYFVAGVHGQWLTEPDGTILMPFYFLSRERVRSWQLAGTVARCKFDGTKMTFIKHGNEFITHLSRGFCEKSITYFNGRYYLTLRNSRKGFVGVSDDGLNFEPVKPWTFDDGSDLGSYNTHQKWVTHSDRLFLVYTRRGANNDHIFRHRAPLFIAQVDPEKLHVIRKTERIVVPERGYPIGNFDATTVTENETWVTVAGPDGFFISRIIWSRPNKLAGRVN